MMKLPFDQYEWNLIVNKIRIAAKLPVLEEDPDASEDGQDGLQDEIAAAVQQSPGAVSNVSGTTAVTQTTAIGGTDQDFDDITYTLPLLYSTADGLLKILAPDNALANDLAAIIDDLKVPGSKIGLQLKKREAVGILRRSICVTGWLMHCTCYRILQRAMLTSLTPNTSIHQSFSRIA